MEAGVAKKSRKTVFRVESLISIERFIIIQSRSRLCQSSQEMDPSILSGRKVCSIKEIAQVFF